MEFNELIAAFAAKYGIRGLDGADGAVELEVDGIRVELLDDPQARSLFACAEIGLRRRGACSPAPKSGIRRPTRTARSAR